MLKKIDPALSWLIGGRRQTASQLLLLPASAWLACFMLAPIALLFVVSFAQRGDYGAISWTFTLKNYARSIDPRYFPVLMRSALYASTTTAVCLALGYPLAYFISFYVDKHKNLLLLLLMLPLWTSCTVEIYAWIIILGREGLINSLLTQIGLIDEPLRLLNRPFAVLIGLIHTYFPFMVLPLYSSLEKLPKAYIEASKDLGGGPWATLWRVTFPLTLPGVFAGCMLTFIPCMGDFLMAEFLGGPSTYLVGNLIQNQFLTAQDWPFGSSLSVLLIAVMMAGLYLQQTLEKKHASW
ncbi:MAG: ABC transporter permease [Elusimicrobia bacterium]|nr:ABC transporter permease [Elusimicrobiota bacterium]